MGKTKKFRGSRTCGGGTHKNRRGAGSKGGTGRAGGCKHHFVKYYKEGFTYGRKGFKTPPTKLRLRAKSILNLGELDELIPELLEAGAAEKVEEKVKINITELGVDKLLARGKITRPLIITGGEITPRARAKIEENGGIIEG